MSGDAKKLFVYGTLLRGEARSQYLDDSRLIETISVPGLLYDTQRGYPAAVFDGNPDGEIRGELYDLSAPDLNEKLRELDEVEGVAVGLYRRREITPNGKRFYAYEAGEQLGSILTDENRIRSGDWRQRASSAFEDAIGFVNRFEAAHRKNYRQFPPHGLHEPVYLQGGIPILITAPHATAHMRAGKLKSEERHTAAIASLLHILEGCHALYANFASEIDPNYSDDAPFKRNLPQIAGDHEIEIVLDLHGTTQERADDIYPGVGEGGEFLKDKGFILDELRNAADETGISVGGLHVFPASRQMTVAKFAARKINAAAMQIEINKRLREPVKDPAKFEKLVKFLRRFISSLGF